MGVSYSFNCALQAPGLLPRCISGCAPGPDKAGEAVLAQHTYARYTETAHVTGHAGGGAKQLPARHTSEGDLGRAARACGASLDTPGSMTACAQDGTSSSRPRIDGG